MRLCNDYKDRGFLIIGVVSEDRSGAPATADYANSYAGQYNWSFPVVTGVIPAAYDPSGGMPPNFMLTTKAMEQYDAYNGVGARVLPEHGHQSLDERSRVGLFEHPRGQRRV